MDALQNAVCRVIGPLGQGVGCVIGDHLLVTDQRLFGDSVSTNSLADFTINGAVVQVKLDPDSYFWSSPYPKGDELFDGNHLGLAVIAFEDKPELTAVCANPIELWLGGCDAEARVLPSDAGTDLQRLVQTRVSWTNNHCFGPSEPEGKALFVPRGEIWKLAGIGQPGPRGRARVCWPSLEILRTKLLMAHTGESVSRVSVDHYRTAMRHFYRREFDQARPILEQAAYDGITDACFHLGILDRIAGVTNADNKWYSLAKTRDKKKHASDGSVPNVEFLDCATRYRLAYYLWGDREGFTLAASLLKKPAQESHLGAQYLLGMVMLQGGEKLDQDHVAAAHWFRKAAAGELAQGECYLGVCLINGQGVPQNHEEGFELIKRAAERGWPHAQYLLSDCLESGTGTTVDVATGLDWLQKAADRRSNSALYVLGCRCLEGDGVPRDEERGLQHLRQAADMGHPWAKQRLQDRELPSGPAKAASAAASGWSVRIVPANRARQRDTATSERATRQLSTPELISRANRGETAAQRTLGERYAKGLTDSLDVGEAFRWLSAAGVPLAQGVEQFLPDTSRAVQYLTIAAKQGSDEAIEQLAVLGEGCIEAQIELGRCCINGWGIAVDHARALECFTAANREQPHADALFFLGCCHAGGIGVTPDTDRGLGLLRDAAKLGSADAKAELGWRYETGREVKPDLDEAERYYRSLLEPVFAAATAADPFRSAALNIPENAFTGLPLPLAQLKLRILVATEKEPDRWKRLPHLQNLLKAYEGDPFLDAGQHGDLTLLTHLKKLNWLATGRTDDQKTALHLAARGGRADCIHFLVECGLGHLLDAAGETPLHCAIREGHLSVAEALVKEGSDAGGRNHEGHRPLHVAAALGRREVVQWLATQPIELEPRDRQGQTPLHLVVGAPSGVAETMDILEEMEIDLEARDVERQTPLHCAVEANSVVAVQRLVKRFNVALDCRDSRGQTPLDRALALNNPEIEHILRNAVAERSGAASSAPVLNAIFQGGSVKGIAYIGAIEEAELRGLLSLKKLHRVGGTSAGAITALLVALGHDSAELQRQMESISFVDFLDLDNAEARASLLAYIERFSAGEDRKALLSDFLSQFGWENFSFTLQALGERRGLFLGDALLNWVKEQMRIATDDPCATFADLHRLRSTRGFKDPYFVAMNVHTGVAETFSYETTPHVCVADAVAASARIPLVYPPIRVHQRLPGSSVELVADKEFVDGGMTDNYPVGLFDRMRYVTGKSRKGYNRPVFNDATLGFRLVDLDDYTGEKPAGGDENFFSYLFRLVMAIRHKQRSDYSRSGDASRSITIFNAGVGMLDFQLSRASMENLIAQGKRGVSEYLRERDRRIGRVTRGTTSIRAATLPAVVPYLREFHVEMGESLCLLREVRLDGCPELVLSLFQPANVEDRHLLSDLRVPVAVTDATGQTALHLAALQEDDFGIIEGLVEAGIDPNTANADGKMALDLAIEQNRWDNALELVESGASVCQRLATLVDYFQDKMLAAQTRRKLDAVQAAASGEAES